MMNRNVKKVWAFSLILCLAVLAGGIGGCGFTKNPAETKPPEGGQQQETAAEYEIVADPDELPAEVKGLVDYLKSKRGYYVFTPQAYATGGDTYLLLSAGEKPTGGYDLDLESARVAGNTLGVVLKEIEPAAAEGVIQVITYPHLVLKIGSGYQNYRIVNDKNENFAAMPAGAVPEILKKDGIYVGQIDNNFIEIEVDGQPQAFMFGPEQAHLLPGDQDLQTGDKILFSYYKNTYGQQVIIALELK